eukprot:TRINITY_DN893_c0_g1_i1.p1 TRINITY_DN893_c0_g1~~TRINITY_DN893_c0_g1_i1.p1  ORF type:complete len:1344 (-),score=525.06 TRINITY_DN893_c0_g1_i1:346-4377(-)
MGDDGDVDAVRSGGVPPADTVVPLGDADDNVLVGETMVAAAPVSPMTKLKAKLLKTPPPEEDSSTDGSSSGSDSKKVAEEDKLAPVGIFELFRFATPFELGLMVVGSICACGHGSLLPLFTILFGDIITAGATPEAVANPDLVADRINTICIKFVILAGVAFVLAFCQVFCWMVAAQRQGARIRGLYVQSLFRQEMGWYDTHDSGELTSRVASDVDVMQRGMGDKVPYFMQYMATFVTGVTIALVWGWKMTMVVLAAVPALVLSGAVFAKTLSEATMQGQAAYSKAGGIAEEVLGLIRTVAAFGSEEQEARRYDEQLEVAARDAKKRAHVSGLGMGVTFFIILCTYALAFWFGNKQVRNMSMKPGDVLTVFFSILIGAMGVGQGMPAINAFNTARGCAPRIFAVIDRVSAIDPLDDEAGEVLDDVQGNLALEAVEFTYPTRQGETILNKMSVSVQRGQTLALVGPSGCGKSTAIQLLERLYDPMNGSVRMDDTDMRTLNVRWMRAQIGFVAQTPTLFATTIRDNIALGAGVDVSVDPATGKRVMNPRPVSEADIIEAAQTANAHDFISRLPEGYDTMLGARGALLSGGQKQRVAIARALVRKPAVLLLDESTSALDSASERVVQVALQRASKGRTTVVIAHRLSTIQDADAIAVVDAGRIVELGTHSELMRLDGGKYRILVQMQNVTDETAEQRDVRKAARAAEATNAAHAATDFAVTADEPSMLTATGVEKSVLVDPSLTDESSSESGKDKAVDVDKGVVMRAIRTNKSEWLYILLGSAGAFAAGAAWPVMAIVFSKVLVLLGDPSDEANASVRNHALAFVAIGGIMALANYAQLAFLGISGERMTKQLRAASFRAMLRQEMAYFDERKTLWGALSTRLATEATLVKGLTGDAAGSIIMMLGAVGVGIVIGLVSCWRVALIVLAVMPGVALGGYLEVQQMTADDSKSRAFFAQAGQIASEAIDNVRTVTSLGVQKHFLAKYLKELEGPVNKGRRAAIVAGLGFGVAEFCIFAVWALAFYTGNRFSARGLCTFSGVLEALTAILFGMMMIGQAAASAPDVSSSMVAATQIFRLLDRQSAIDPCGKGGEQPSDVDGAVALKDVEFNYPSRPDVPVLRGLTAAVAPGKTLALVGESGSGKSTVVSLLERFYDIAAGSLTLDEREAAAYNVGNLRSHLAIVSQEPDLFSMSVRDNIAYGFTNTEGTVVTDAQIEAAARLANAHDFIMALPDGYASEVGERGGRLSGGQRQRVAIARALVRQPKVLLLDESTAALDSISEKAVQDALDKAASSRTTVVIAHRLSSIQSADAIAVVAQGAVVEMGTHQELMARQGAYALLVQNQTMDH